MRFPTGGAFAERQIMDRLIKPVAVQADGTRFEGFYAVQSDMLTVWHEHLGSRTTRVAAGTIVEQVDALLLEIFRDCRHRRVAISIARR